MSLPDDAEVNDVLVALIAAIGDAAFLGFLRVMHASGRSGGREELLQHTAGYVGNRLNDFVLAAAAAIR